MNESMPNYQEDLRPSPRKYRIQFRNRNGLQGREVMIVCTNFIVNTHNHLVYSNLQGKLQRVELKPGDYFDVKVMG